MNQSSHLGTEVSTGDWLDRLSSAHPMQAATLEELRALLRAFLTRALAHDQRADHFFIDDMTQNALLKILEKKSTFTGRSRFTTWAYTLAIRTAFSELRRRHWDHVSLDTLNIENETPPDDGALNSLQSSIRTELHQRLSELIRTRLTPAQCEVLQAELRGMPQDEIARQTGRSRNATYKLFHDARRALKKALEDDGITAHTLANIYKD